MCNALIGEMPAAGTGEKRKTISLQRKTKLSQPSQQLFGDEGEQSAEPSLHPDSPGLPHNGKSLRREHQQAASQQFSEIGVSEVSSPVLRKNDSTRVVPNAGAAEPGFIDKMILSLHKTDEEI